MSFYPGMLEPSKDCSQYLLQFNGLGDITCYAINGDGKATSFVTGTIRDVLNTPILRASKGSRWIGAPIYQGDSPHAWGFGRHETWRAVVAAMNGKAGTSRTDARAVYRTLHGTGASIKEFIIRGDSHHYFLNTKAEAYDEIVDRDAATSASRA